MATPRHLEELPPEIRTHILSVLDLPSLKALVRASSIYHQQYRLDRTDVLRQSLHTTLGRVLIDALAVRMSETSGKKAKVSSIVFLNANTLISDTYQSRLHLINDVEDDALPQMASFYLRYVRPLATYFSNWLLKKLSKEKEASIPFKEDHSATVDYQPTSSELTRLVRAIYRFHLVANIVDPADSDLASQRHELITLFIDSIEPWEVEEFLSFYQFVERKYTKCLLKAKPKQHASNWDHQVFRGSMSGPSLSIFDTNLIEGAALRGLPILYSCLFLAENAEQANTFIHQGTIRLDIGMSVTTSGIFATFQQDYWNKRHPTDRRRLHENRVPCTFRGDSNSGGPPLAWTLIWEDTYSNLFGGYTSDKLRRWGYIFWDAATLQSMGAEQVLQRQWSEAWKRDPRDPIRAIS